MMLSPLRFGNVAHIVGTKADLNLFIRYEQRNVATDMPDTALWKSPFPEDDRYEQVVLISGADLKNTGLTPKTAHTWDFDKALEFAKAQVRDKLKLGTPLRGARMMVGQTREGERAAFYQYHPQTADYQVPDAEKTKAAEKTNPSTGDSTSPAEADKPARDRRGRKKAPRRQSGHQRLKILGLLEDPLETTIPSDVGA